MSVINYKFKSQIATTLDQSERLVGLGLNEHTADMCYIDYENGYTLSTSSFSHMLEYWEKNKDDMLIVGLFPAWTLHRLLEICPKDMIDVSCETVSDHTIDESVPLYYSRENNLYDNLINCIEDLISVGKIDSEFLTDRSLYKL